MGKQSTANIYITATDKTKAAFSSITGNIKMLGGALLGIGAAVGVFNQIEQSFKKFADLNDVMDNFDMAAESVLGFTDAMRNSGIQAEGVKKSFEDLSTNITKGLTDEKIATTFKELGVSFKDLKTAKVEDIFKKILDNVGQAEDKAKALTNLKDIFGKQGLKLLDLSQDDRFKQTLERAIKFKDEIRTAAYNTDELDKNLMNVGNILTNDIAMAFGPILVSVNALLQAFSQTYTETTKAKTQLEIIAKANYFKDLINDAIDFADMIVAVFKKASDIIGGVFGIIGGLILKTIPHINLVGDAVFGGLIKAFQSLIPVVNLVGDTIAGGIITAIRGAISSIGDLGKALYSVVKGDFENARKLASQGFDFSKGWENYKNKIKEDAAKIDFGGYWQAYKDKLIEDKQKIDEGNTLGSQIIEASWETMTDSLKTGTFDSFKAKFNKAYKDALDKTIEAVNKQDKKPTPRQALKDPFNLSSYTSNLIKQIEAQLQIGKDNIDYLQKYNEIQYDNQLTTIEDYYLRKQGLAETDFKFTQKMINDEIAILERAKSASKKNDEKLKFDEQINDLLVKRNKAEQEYELKVEEFNNKVPKEILKNKLEELDLDNQLKDIYIEKILLQKELNGISFEDENKIKAYQLEKIKNIQLEIDKILEKKTLEELTNKEKLDVESRKLAIDKIKTDMAKEDYQKALDKIDIEKEYNKLAIENTQLQLDGGASIFETNLQLKTLKEQQIAILQKEIDKLKEKAILDDKDKLLIAQKQAEIEKVKRTTDQLAQDINKSLGKSFEGLFTDIMSGTKSIEDSFKDMAKSIAGTINNLVAQDLGKALYKSIFPDDKNGNGGLGGAISQLFGKGTLPDIGSIFGGGGNSAGGGMGSFFGDIGNWFSGLFADGGYVNGAATKPYIVGERGAEVFWPNQSGYVTSNKDSQQLMGSGGNNIVVNIQTKDANSFRNSESQIAAQMQRMLAKGNRNN